MTGTARNVLDWVAYMELVDRVNALCDSTATALAAMPAFLKGNAAARRGRAISHLIPTVAQGQEDPPA